MSEETGISVETGKEMILLLRDGAAIGEGKLPGRRESFHSWEKLYRLAGRNSVEAAAWLGAKRYQEEMPEAVRTSWKKDSDRTLLRQLHFDTEREEILKELEKEGISYLPLKGILISGYYPCPGMRSMADNDILYGIIQREGAGWKVSGRDEKEQERTALQAQKKLVALMEGRGYWTENLKGNHDTFHRKPFYNFEMHRKLMSASSEQGDYYRNPWERACQDQENPFHFYFSDEDEYLYLITHDFKHYDGSGCGIRMVLDLHYFLRKKGGALDWDYVERELEKLKLRDFERKLKRAAEEMFREGELSEETESFLLYLLGCGTYGTQSEKIRRRLDRLDQGNRKKARRDYVRERFFPDRETVRENFPFFARHRYLLWLLPVYRLGRGLVKNRRNLIRELRLLWVDRRNEE